MFKTGFMALALIGSVSASAAEVNRDQLMTELKADMIATCITKRAELQKMVKDPTPITAEVCESFADQLLSVNSPRSLQPVISMMIEKKEDKATLKKMKKDLLSMEKNFDHLQADTIVARPALINLTNKLLKI